MQKSLIALLLSLIFHALLLLLYLLFELQKPNEHERRISARHIKIEKNVPSQESIQSQIKPSTPPEKIPTQALKQQEEIQQIPQKSSLKRSTHPPKESKKLKSKEAMPKSSAPVKRIESSKELIATEVPVLEKSKPQAQTTSTPTIYDLSQKFENSDIKELYGDEFFSLTREEQEFIEDNLSKIGAITQRYLKYPQIAGELGQEGINAVEFFLHPNGDISDLRLLHALGYTLLDKNSIKTIQIAYKDYPLPSRTTKIRIKVHYKIYGR